MSEVDRRRFVRVPLSYVVKCEKYIFVSGNAQIDATSKNISESGMLFETEAPYTVGDALKLEIYFPESQPLSGTSERVSTMHAVAKVVRSAKRPDGMFDVAVHFSSIRDEERQALHMYVRQRVEDPA